MTTKSSAQIINKLEKILLTISPTSLKWAVISEILAEDEPEVFIWDVINHGCVSGTVSGLIYYSQTHQFYDTHYDEIEELRFELEEQWIPPVSIEWDLKNHYAWIAFENTTYQLALELGLEI